jgi:methylated-DNA-protein-cysteine methyltransferase-like protein
MRKIPDSYARIWATVCRIPRGKVSTYGTVARLAGFGQHARLVGYALHALPKGSDIPWHRVINAQGKISLRRSGGGEGRQESRLRREGIRTVKGRVDLSGFGWPQGIRERAGRRTRSRRD